MRATSAPRCTPDLPLSQAVTGIVSCTPPAEAQVRGAVSAQAVSRSPPGGQLSRAHLQTRPGGGQGRAPRRAAAPGPALTGTALRGPSDALENYVVSTWRDTADREAAGPRPRRAGSRGGRRHGGRGQLPGGRLGSLHLRPAGLWPRSQAGAAVVGSLLPSGTGTRVIGSCSYRPFSRPFLVLPR